MNITLHRVPLGLAIKWPHYAITATDFGCLRFFWTVNLSSCLLPIQIRAEQIAKEGWEYSPVFTMKFHAKERKMDLVRRRRWHRKMVQEDASAPAVFHIDVGKGDDDVRISNNV